jgi:DNA-binding NtrC family response regulator
MPVGGDRWIPVQARVIAVTARDLERAVEAEAFREDLFYRLVVGRVALPPLRGRDGDVPVLAEHFWRRATGRATPMPTDLLASYAGYAWPGNVRELAHVVERRALLGVEAPEPEAAPPEPGTEQAFRRVLELDLPLTQARERIVAEFERAYLERVIAKHGGNITRAAAASGIARRYFHQLKARHKAG